jgi:hypothetical protein
MSNTDILLYLDVPTNLLNHFSYLPLKLEGYALVKCPTCGKDVAKPERALKNGFFLIESYTCKTCKTEFKKIS